MNLHELLFGCTALFAAISCGCTVWVVFRDARWRKSGLAAQLEARVASAEQAALKAREAALRWHETQQGVVVMAQVDRNTTRVQRCEEQLEHMATREDVARLEGRLGRIEHSAESAAKGVDRIEGMLMTRALNQ